METVYEPKIKYYQQRSFGEKINVTFDFLRENFKPLSKILLILEGPIVLVLAFLGAINQQNMIEGLSSGPQNIPDFSNAFGTSYFLSLALTVVFIFSFFAIILRYMKLYETTSPDQITYKDILPKLFSDSGMIFGGSILYMISMFLGFMIFFFPGIYIAVAFSMAFTIIVFEGEDALGALSRSSKLIKGKWWSTFGLLFVMYLLQMIVVVMFYLPTYAVMFLQIFKQQDEIMSLEEPDVLTTIMQSVFMVIAYVGMFFSYSLSAFAISFQYFNLKEKHESYGLMQEIDKTSDE